MAFKSKVYGVVLFLAIYVAVPIIIMRISDLAGLPAYEIGEFFVMLGVVLSVIGAILAVYSLYLLSCYGGGTPVPTDPTIRLVIRGPYKYRRNPAYIGHVLFAAGFAITSARPLMIVYPIGLLAFLYFFVHYYEEPGLIKRFGNDYKEYMKKVPRRIL
jgi:protein-S-isoprenylcysteine O-methyltransferase Ste14